MKRLTVALLAALAAGGCKADTTGPNSGTLGLQLANAVANDRALLIQLVGTDTSARIDTVLAAAGSSYRVFALRQASARWRVIVVGSLGNGALVSFAVPDKTKTTAYSATILDVANAAFADLPPGSRALSVTP
jgi:hypothetical protein